jgi:hypothetical protein
VPQGSGNPPYRRAEEIKWCISDAPYGGEEPVLTGLDLVALGSRPRHGGKPAAGGGKFRVDPLSGAKVPIEDVVNFLGIQSVR